ncbi:MAG: hypothetical protein IPK50_06380 [Fibrobacterota bacterium]|nr:MAG: hypothetical protein IPK50_06380 [Fibrobacterota bacterium]
MKATVISKFVFPGHLILIIGCSSYSPKFTQEDLKRAEYATNYKRIEYSNAKMNENVAKFRINHFKTQGDNAAAAKEDSAMRYLKSLSSAAKDGINEAQQNEEKVRESCCKSTEDKSPP